MAQSALKSTTCENTRSNEWPRFAVFSDAGYRRNGAAAYYEDLCASVDVSHKLSRFVFPDDKGEQTSPLQPKLSVPMPGDKTQRLYYPKSSSIKHLLKKNPPQVIVVATPGPYGMLGLKLAQRWRLPLVVGVHTSFEKLVELYWHKKIFGRITQRYFTHAHRKLLESADMIMVNSRKMVELCERLGGQNIRLIGTPLNEYCREQLIAEPRAQIQQLLFAGRLAPEKNIEQVIDAAQKLTSLRFVIAGDGPLKTQVVEASNELSNVTYLGWLNTKNLVTEMDRADMLVLPSKEETFGTVAVEMMARKRLAMVSTGCGIIDWPELKNELFIIDDKQTLSDAIATAAMLDGTALRQRAQQSFTAAWRHHEQALETWRDTFNQAMISA